MAVVTTNLGVITAYGDAVAAGYRGTKAEWQALMANYATVGQQAAQDAQTASQAAQTATTKAGEASQSATRAETAAASITAPDTTLTQAGVAADAKATGDEIADLKEGLEDIINAAYVTDSANGSVARFADGADDIPMKSVKVAIEPIQSGTGDPSPDNVRPISGWDSVKVTRAGKNLFQCPTSGGRTNSGIAWTYNSDGSVTASGTATGNSWSYGTPPSVMLPQGTYTVSVTSPFGLVVQNLTDGGYFYNGGNSKVTFTIEKQTEVSVCARVGNGSTINATTGIQIEEGTEKTEFQPFNRSVCDISIPTEAGTVYGGTLDVVSGELTVKYGSFLLNDVVIGRLTYSSVNVFRVNPPLATTGLTTDGWCEAFKTDTVSANKNNTITFASSYWSSDNKRIVIKADEIETVEAFKERFGNCRVVYRLAEPLTYQLTPTEINSLLGINNVWSDAGDVEAEYRADTKLYIDKRLGV